MTLNGTERIVREVYHALAARNPEGAAEKMDEGVLLLNVATGDVYRGRAGYLEYARSWAAAVPDITLRFVTVGGGGERAVVEYEIAGTHTGPLVTPRGHVPATGMEVQVRFCDVLEVRQGSVSHIRSYFDSVTLLRQLGILTSTPIHSPERRAALGLYAQPVESNAPQRNKAIVQRYVQDVFNRQNPGAVVDTCSRDYTWHGGSLGEARGMAAYQDVLSTLLLAFPDLEMEVLDCVTEGDRVAVRFTLRGTHLGEFQGFPPTFNGICGGGTNIYRVEKSRIVEEWWQGDVLILLQQMNAAPATVPLTT